MKTKKITLNELRSIVKQVIKEETNKPPFKKLVVDIDSDEGFLVQDENKYNKLLPYGKINKTQDEPFDVFGFLWYEWLEIPNSVAKKI